MAERPHTEPTLTVEAALRLPSMRRGAPEVVAGHGHLRGRIRWVHSSEVPDIAAHLKGDELLLQTGMGIDRSPQGQRAYIAGLAERRIAALVLELGEVFERVPQPLVKAALAADLPLIVLHRAVPFIEVTEEIHAELVSDQLAALRRGSELSAHLTSLMLGGAGIADLLSELAAALQNPVVLEGADGEPLFHATYRGDTTEVLEAWAQARRSTGPAPQSSARTLSGARGPTTLVALGLDTTLDESADELLDRASDLVALALTRSREELLLAARERGNFLADVAAERLDPNDAAARAHALGFEHHRGALLPIVFAVDGDPDRWSPVWRAVRTAAQDRGLPMIIGPQSDDALAVVGLANAGERMRAAAAVADAARDAARRHLGRDESSPAIAVGEAVTRWDELPRVLREALETATIARELPPRAWHDAAAADVTRLLWTLRDDPRINDFVRRRLGPILRHDAQRAAKLMPTLEALSEHYWNKSDSARALHLNRQALYPRLARIERLLGVDLNDLSVRFGLDLAVKAHRTQRAGGVP